MHASLHKLSHNRLRKWGKPVLLPIMVPFNIPCKSRKVSPNRYPLIGAGWIASSTTGIAVITALTNAAFNWRHGPCESLYYSLDFLPSHHSHPLAP